MIHKQTVVQKLMLFILQITQHVYTYKETFVQLQRYILKIKICQVQKIIFILSTKTFLQLRKTVM